MPDIRRALSELEIENFEHKPFVPLNKLKILFNRNLITDLLKQHEIPFYDHQEKIPDIIRNDGLRLFATLATIGSIGCITRFIRADHLDSKMPLSEASLSKSLPDALTCTQFFREQWKFLSPIFEAGQYPREYHDRTVLPFLSCDHILDGGFSSVSKIKVDISHHRITSNVIEPELVWKRLLKKSGQDESLIDAFNREVHILSSLRYLKHPNIINLITAFEKGRTCNFLFPLASGDLENLLGSSSGLTGFQTQDEIVASLWGLSSALEKVHEFCVKELNIEQVGCHYDIKPRNILCLEGKLVLSDFGLSRLRPVEKGSRSYFKKGEGSYLAPECEPSDNDYEPGKIGRASDVWSLGCVLAEVLAYMSGGTNGNPDEVERFYEVRKIKLGNMICHHFHGTDKINPKVAEFLDDHISKSPESLKSLAYIIKDMLQFEADHRIPTPLITLRLFQLSQRSTVKKLRTALDEHTDSMDFEQEIVLERLNIWAQVTGLDFGPPDNLKSAWFATPHSLEEYLRLEGILGQCVTEIGFIVARIGKIGKEPYHTFGHLKRLLDELWDTQSSSVRAEMIRRLEDEILKKWQKAGSRELGIDMGRDESSLELEKETNGSIRLDYRRMENLFTMKEIASAMKEEESGQSLWIQESSLIRRKNLDDHTQTFTLQDTEKRVLVENLEYGHSWIGRESELIERVKSIASLRSQDVIKETFPVLQCIGYYNDNSNRSFGVVYSLPHLARGEDPVNLTQIFGKTKSRIQQPSLTQKFKLASSLVSHILNFHRGDWLHKNVSSFNIICFPTAFPTIAESLSSPFFIGFNHSRHNDERNYSSLDGPEAEYRHPAYLQNQRSFSGQPAQRFRQEFDYYSVGMVLIELAFWKPIGEITKNVIGSPEEMRKHLLQEEMRRVRTCMGDAYAKSVNYCLDCYSGDDRDDEQVRNDFNDKVVTVISQCIV